MGGYMRMTVIGKIPRRKLDFKHVLYCKETSSSLFNTLSITADNYTRYKNIMRFIVSEAELCPENQKNNKIIHDGTG